MGGILFVLLTIGWALLLMEAPSPDDSDQEIVRWFADSGNRGQIFFSFVLLALAGIFFLWFLASLCSRLRAAEGGLGRVTALAFAAGVALASLLFVKSAVLTAFAAAADVDEFKPDADLYRVLETMAYFLIGLEGATGGLLVGAASVIALRTGFLSRAAAWTGVVVGLVLVLGTLPLFGLPLILFLLWVLWISVLLLTGRLGGAHRAAPES